MAAPAGLPGPHRAELAVSDDSAFGVQYATGTVSPACSPDGSEEGVCTARRLDATDGRIALTGTP